MTALQLKPKGAAEVARYAARQRQRGRVHLRAPRFSDDQRSVGLLQRYAGLIHRPDRAVNPRFVGTCGERTGREQLGGRYLQINFGDFPNRSRKQLSRSLVELDLHLLAGTYEFDVSLIEHQRGFKLFRVADLAQERSRFEKAAVVFGIERQSRPGRQFVVGEFCRFLPSRQDGSRGGGRHHEAPFIFQTLCEALLEIGEGLFGGGNLRGGFGILRLAMAEILQTQPLFVTLSAQPGDFELQFGVFENGDHLSGLDRCTNLGPFDQRSGHGHVDAARVLGFQHHRGPDAMGEWRQ
jgi:hypothetical protein